MFLAACSPSESAFEYNVDGTNRHGALTYWMIHTLASSAPGLTYRMLYDRVNALIQSKFREQTPMLIGEGDRLIFGSESIAYEYTVTVMDVNAANPDKVLVKLSAGTATGLEPGAQFAIYPFGTADLSQKEAQMAIVEIGQDHEITAADAWAEVIQILHEGEIQLGSPAVLLAPPVTLVRSVALVKKTEGEAEDQLPPDWMAQQETALNAVQAAMAGQGWLKLVTENSPREDFQVAVNRSGDYEICVGLPLDNIRPALAIGASKAAQEVVRRLVHLAKYQAVQELRNPFSDLAHQLEVELIPKSGPFPEQTAGLSNVKLKSGQEAILRIKNISAAPLNVVVLDLEPTWEISQLQLQRMRQKFYPFAPGMEIPVRQKLTLPNNAQYDKGLEVIKIFAMAGQADFRWLELPPLDQALPTAALRGLSARSEPVNALEALFAAIGADADQPPATERAQVIFDPGKDWVTKEIQIIVER